MLVRKMARPGEVSFLLALFVLLVTLHGTKAQYYQELVRAEYDDYDDSGFDEDGYDNDNEEYEDEDADAGYPSRGGYPGYPSYPSYPSRGGYPSYPSHPSRGGYPGYPSYREYGEPEIDSEGDSEDGEGSPPTDFPENQEFTPDCNNVNCRIRVDWQPPPRDTWMSCLLGYRVGFRRDGTGTGTEDEWFWMNDQGTHRDLRSDKLFFFEEAEGTNHSLTIRNLEFQTAYEVTIEVFNPYGAGQSWNKPVRTPSGYFIYFQRNTSFCNPSEPCRDASVPEPERFVTSSENSLSVNLAGWQEDANCEPLLFMVDQRWQNFLCS